MSIQIAGRRVHPFVIAAAIMIVSFVGSAIVEERSPLFAFFAFGFGLSLLAMFVIGPVWLVRRTMEEHKRDKVAKAAVAAESRRPTPYAFNPPPGWPTPEPDWVPAPGWEPEKSWPEPPDKWLLWQRVVPRPPRPQRASPWDPDPNAGKFSTEVDREHIWKMLQKPANRRVLGVQLLHIQAVALRMRAAFDQEYTRDDRHPFSKSRWHPLPWDFRYAVAALEHHAEELGDKLFENRGDDEDDVEGFGVRLDKIDEQDFIDQWTTMYRWLGETFELLEEGKGLGIAEAISGSSTPDEALDPGPAGWQQAEELAARALRGFGFNDAGVTGSGTDRGLDVSGRNIAAQIKYTNAAIGRPVIQQLVGASGGRQTAFFSRTGYTEHAIEEANRNGMALFRIALPNKITAVNAVARQMSGQ